MNLKNRRRQNQHDTAITWTPERLELKERILGRFQFAQNHTFCYQLRGKNNCKNNFDSEKVILEQLILDGLVKVHKYEPQDMYVYFTYIGLSQKLAA